VHEAREHEEAEHAGRHRERAPERHVQEANGTNTAMVLAWARSTRATSGGTTPATAAAAPATRTSSGFMTVLVPPRTAPL
jgi:hypothetical protein